MFYKTKVAHLSIFLIISCALIQSESTATTTTTTTAANATDPHIRGVGGLEHYFQSSSILYGLSELSANVSHLSNERCRAQLSQIRDAVLQKQAWALKVLDASASQPAGFMFMHNFWFGSRETCDIANEKLHITLYPHLKRNTKPSLIEDLAPFELDYRVVYVKHNSPWQLQLTMMTEHILHLGLCIPAVCTNDEIQSLTKDLLSSGRFQPAVLYEFDAEVLYVKDLKLREDFFERRSLKIMVVILICTLGLLWAASHGANSTEKLANVNGSAVQSNGSVGQSEDTSISNGSLKSENRKSSQSQAIEEASLSRIQAFIKCFEINKNCRDLFTFREFTDRDIPIVNGLRSMLAFLVLLVHVPWFSRHTVNNAAFVQNDLERNVIQMHSLGIYLVDALFTVSGFLHVFLFLRDKTLLERIRQNNALQNAQLFFIMLMHRLLRQAPLSMVMMCLADLTSALLHDVSIFHIYERYDLVCPQSWWQNMFFIQNFFPYDRMCVQWSWSLSCEMQYFIWTTILLFVYVRHPSVVKSIVVALLAGTFALTIYKGIIHRFQLASECIHHTMSEIYTDPFVRVAPYLGGAVVAWHWLTRTHPLRLSPLSESVLWNVAFALFLGSSCTMNLRSLDYVSSTLMYTLGRCLMSLSICCMIVGSAFGRGCWWSRMLSTKFFQHINRLTYAVYMSHPLIILLFSSLMYSSATVNFSLSVLLVAGIGLMTYLIAIALTLTFEIPYSNWSRAILKGAKKKVS